MQPAATVCDEPSAESLWGDLAGLNLAGYDDWDDEELQQVDVEAVVAQLCSTQQQDDACEPLLQQLCSPDAPPYAIIGCDLWPQLANLLPWLLTSCQPGTATAAEELLQQQLAAELLHCSPEPLAQLLAALLQPQLRPSASINAEGAAGAAAAHLCVSAQRGHVTAASSAATTGPCRDSCSLGPHGCEPPPASAQQVYNPSVLQFITRGLQKLGRQWHFLDKELSDQLCTAIMVTLLQPLLQLTSYATHAAATAAAAASQGGLLNSSSWLPTLTQQQGLQQQHQTQRCGFETSTQAQVSSPAAAAAAAAIGPPNQQASIRQDSHIQQGQEAVGTPPSQQQHSNSQQLDDSGDPLLLLHHTPPHNCHSPVQQQQQQQHCHRGALPLWEQQQSSSCAAVYPQHPPVAVQLLQHYPSLSWWHRLNANNASSRPLKAAAAHQGLTHTLMHWTQQTALQQTAQQQERSVSSSSSSHAISAATDQQQLQQPGCGLQEGCSTARSPQPCTSSSRHGASCMYVSGSHAAVSDGCCEGQVVTLVDCLALHCLAAFMSTHSGRQLLQGAVLQQQQEQQQPNLQPEQQQQQDSQQQEPAGAAATCNRGLTAQPVPAEDSSRPQPLSLALCCLQEWARLQTSTQPRSPDPQQVQTDAALGPAVPVVSSAAAAAAAASRAPAASDLTVMPQQQVASGLAADCQVDQPAAADAALPAGEAVVQAAAAAAARAVQAYEEQQPWFDTAQP